MDVSSIGEYLEVWYYVMINWNANHSVKGDGIKTTVTFVKKKIVRKKEENRRSDCFKF